MKKLLIFLLIIMLFPLGFQKVDSAEIDYSEYWFVVNVVGTVYSMSACIDVTEYMETVNFTVVDLGYNYQTVSTYESNLAVYDGPILLFDEDLDTIIEDNGTTFEGQIDIDLDQFIIDGTYGDFQLDDEDTYTIDYICINVMQTFTAVPTLYEEQFQGNSPILIDVDYHTIRYFSKVDNAGTIETELYQIQTVYGDLPSKITDPDDLSTTNVFEYWAFLNSNGEWIKYDYDIPIDNSMYTGNNTYVFMVAVFTDYIDDFSDDYSTVENTPTNLENLLDGIGMNNTAGHVILYTLLNLLIVVVITVTKANPIYVAVVSIVVTSLFVFFNILPIYITIIVILLYILFFATNQTRGSTL